MRLTPENLSLVFAPHYMRMLPVAYSSYRIFHESCSHWRIRYLLGYHCLQEPREPVAIHDFLRHEQHAQSLEQGPLRRDGRPHHGVCGLRKRLDFH